MFHNMSGFCTSISWYICVRLTRLTPFTASRVAVVGVAAAAAPAGRGACACCCGGAAVVPHAASPPDPVIVDDPPLLLADAASRRIAVGIVVVDPPLPVAIDAAAVAVAALFCLEKTLNAEECGLRASDAACLVVVVVVFSFVVVQIAAVTV